MWNMIIGGIAQSWMVSRLKERTSWNGIALMGVGAAILLGLSIIDWAAWAAIIYGAWQVYQKEIK